MSAFEDFVQLELPKRPYLETDVAQETVIIRRGPGPRQLSAIQLTEGQVLGFSGGVLTGVDGGGGGGFGIRKYIFQVTTPVQNWTIAHNLNSTNLIMQPVNAAGFVLLPDEMRIVDPNTVVISFNTAQTGTARLLFLD